MSRKIDVFRQAIGNPLAIHNFTVTIPDFDGFETPLTVQSTTFPAESLQEILLFYLGERVKWPTIATNSGTWSVSIPENEDGMAFHSVMQAKGYWWNYVNGKMLAGKTTNIDVTLRTVNDEEVFKVRLHNCWCKGRSDANLSSNSPTTPLQFNVTFSYDWIEDLSLKKPELNAQP